MGRRELELRVELVTQNNKNDLKDILDLFAKEVFGSNEADLDMFVDGHPLGIYIVYDGFIAVGFSSFSYNAYYGLREPTIGNDYTFVRKDYRRTMAFHLLSLQTGAVIKNNGCNLEHYIVEDSGSMKFIGTIKGTKIYEAYEYDKDDVLEVCDSIRDRYYRFTGRKIK